MGKSFSNPIGAATNIATGGMVGYSDGHFGTGAVSGIADKASGGAITKGIDAIGDTLLGKKDPGQAAQTIDLNSAQGTDIQNTLLNQLSSVGSKDYGRIAQNQTDQQENQARQGVADSEMIARQNVAQRGLGNTSMGLNAINGANQNLGSKIGEIRAGKLGLENQMQQQGLGLATHGVNAILGQQANAKIYSPAVASKGRQGGLMPLIGAGVGGYFGGAEGAKMGMGIGQAATQVG
jgi:hypothetical protein